MKYYSATKKNKQFMNNMDEFQILTERSQTQKVTYCNITFM